jgi:alpha-mannosidase II
LEFVTGGWVQPDEANSNLDALEIQMQEGRDWIADQVGPEFVPHYGWSIDPFGYSPSLPYLLKAQFQFRAILIQRVHYAVKKELAQRKQLEFYWRQTWDDDSASSSSSSSGAGAAGTYDLFTHLMPFYSYDTPHTCGPDPAVCCQFDFARNPIGNSGSCPWGRPPVPIVRERSLLLLDQYLKKANLYRGPAVLIPLGDDFRYQTLQEANHQYTNYQKIFDYINQNVPGVQIQFGTLSQYFQAVQGTFRPPILKGSFFTYADVNQDYWSGYFTSRVFDKALDRHLERVLYAANPWVLREGICSSRDDN